jgi:hypothetical protein
MIKEKIKKIPFLGTKLVSVYAWYLRLNNRKFLKKNFGIKNKFAGRRCFILATGPSISSQNLLKLAGEFCISVSNFFVHPDFKTIKPVFHLFAACHPPITEGQFVALLQDAEKHFPEGQKIFISITDKYVVDKYELFKKHNIYYYYLGLKTLKITDKINFTKQLPKIQTSPQIAIYLALYLGAKEIDLLGVDHDWILHIGKTKHFYDEKQNAASQTGYNEWVGDLEHEFLSYLNLWRIYKMIRTYAAVKKIPIINLTPGGLLDIFPRKTLEETLDILSQDTTQQ